MTDDLNDEEYTPRDDVAKPRAPTRGAVARARVPRILAVVPGLIPTAIIGVLRPLMTLERRGLISLKIRYNTTKWFCESDIRWCDTAVFCRASEVDDLIMLYELRRLSKRIIYEIDDNFNEIPLTTSVGAYHRDVARLHAMRRFFEVASMSRIYTDEMAALALRHKARVRRCRSYFDSAIIRGLVPRQSSRTVRMAYPTGRLDDPRLEEMFFSALRAVLTKYRDAVELHMWCKEVPYKLAGLANVKLQKTERSYETFIRSFYKMGFDIGLAPLIDEPFFRSKSDNKFREFGGCGIVGVYSKQKPYTDSVQDRVTGILVGGTSEAWIEALEELIQKPALRQSIAGEARQYVCENYKYEDYVDGYYETIQQVLDLNPACTEWLPPRPPAGIAKHRRKPRFSGLFIGTPDDPTIVREEGALTQYQEFQRSVHALGGTAFMRQNTYGVIINPTMIRESDVVMISIRGLQDCVAASTIVPMCRSIILDVSALAGEAESVATIVRSWRATCPMSVVWTTDQRIAMKPIEALFAHEVVIAASDSVIVDHFSLGGRSAAYLDLVEKHIRYRRKRKRVHWFQKLTSKGVRRLHVAWEWRWNRLKAAFRFWLWRLGSRRL